VTKYTNIFVDCLLIVYLLI